MVNTRQMSVVLLASLAVMVVGCSVDLGQVDQLIRTFSAEANRTIDNVQDVGGGGPPAGPPPQERQDLPDEVGDRGGITIDTEIVIEFDEEYVEDDPVTFLSVYNDSDYEVYFEAFIDDIVVEFFLLPGESTWDYDLFVIEGCVGAVGYTYELGFDPFTGEPLYELFPNIVLTSPLDFDCGGGIEINITNDDTFPVVFTPELIDELLVEIVVVGGGA